MNDLSYPLKVFISHKVKEMGTAAKELTIQFRRYGDKEKLKIFLSPEIETGSEWDIQVHQALHESDIFILLYLNYSEEMNWSLYESGFFAADAITNKHRKLICVHPENYPAPGPLKKWQNVETNRQGIIKLLHTVFDDNDRPVKPELFTEEFSATYQELIDKVLNILGPGEIVTPLTHRVRITFPAPNGDELIENLKHGEMPENAWIWGETEALRQFGIGPSEGILLSKLKERLDYPYAITYFIFTLARTIANILEGNAGPFPLPPIRVHRSRSPRTLVFTTLTERPNGDKIFEFVASERLPTTTCGVDDPYSTIYRLLAIALHFRCRVIMTYEKELHNMVYDQEETDKFRSQVDNTLSHILNDINAVILDSLNRGIASRGQLINAFEEDAQALEKITEIIKSEDGLWERAIGKLLQAKENGDIKIANTAMQEIRDINKTTICIASKRLAELAIGLTGINYLDKGDATL